MPVLSLPRLSRHKDLIIFRSYIRQASHSKVERAGDGRALRSGRLPAFDRRPRSVPVSAERLMGATALGRKDR